MRFTEIDGAATELAIELRERARAIDVTVAAFDHDVGVGADEREPARREPLELLAIVFRAFDLVIEGAGDENEIGIGFADTFDSRPVEQCEVAIRPDVVAARSVFVACEAEARRIAGSQNAVIDVVRNAHLLEHDGQRVRRPRRVRQQQHMTALRAEVRQRFRYTWIGAASVMQHAPDIAEKRIVFVGNCRKAGDQHAPSTQLS